ncbi:pyridoxal phosphate-dependent decarboxylase family protein [Egicoccus halophilus]|uniref:Aspartate aminotransferase family protein n=1 Tax=Egicoccus halophilus TaxID=1670830 RepID=A0A8J3A7P1_9ACTN|nr:aminotransferase class V-fold PLP-dependent enzyme [Egicoccus halophilus]GGI05633.1 aspartate aminotransferase family protein [Egicoccus halophilus]
MDEIRTLLTRTAELAADHLAAPVDTPVSRPVDPAALVAVLGGPLPDGPSDPLAVVESLARDAAPGLVRTNAGRYFGFVEGGVLPAALAADWLASTYDQNPGFAVLSPTAAALETVCQGWLLELLGLPSHASVGFTTGAQAANVTGLAAGRGEVLRRVGWDVDADGLFGAPPVTVVVGEERHATIGRALRLLGMGERRVVVQPADDQGRMTVAGLRERIGDGPAIVCAQAGNVNTGACDPMRAVTEVAHDAGAWVHVDGAFGLWAAASPDHRDLVDGIGLADSWATDGHKWLNVPYDSGFVICASPEAHRRAMTLSASYLARQDGGRDGTDWTPESSRRARAFAVWAALRSLGRTGVGDLVARCCTLTARFVDLLAEEPAVTVLNDVVLNQALVRVGDDDARTLAVAAEVQRAGVVWLGTTVRRGVTSLRISVSDHATTEGDVEVAAAEVRRAIAVTA